MPHGLLNGFGILLCKIAKFADKRVFFKDDPAFAVGIDFKRITFADTQSPSNFLRYYNSAEFVNSTYYSCCFHLQ